MENKHNFDQAKKGRPRLYKFPHPDRVANPIN
jgi:hypothetical protein